MPLIALEVVLGFGVPVGWAVWELIALRREKRRDAERAAAREGLPVPDPTAPAPADTLNPPSPPAAASGTAASPAPRPR